MNEASYKIPFNFKPLMEEQGTASICSVAESIAQNLMLLITTKKGENRFNENYGNAVWDFEFDNAVTNVMWETVFISSLRQQIEEHELRIVNPKIKVHIEYVEHTYETRHYKEVKKRAKIGINAQLADSGEQYTFSTELFLSPISVD